MPPKKNKTKKSSSAKKNKRTTRKKKSNFSLRRWLLKWIFILGLWGAIILSLIIVYYAHDLPDVGKLDEEFRTPKITILDKNGDSIANVGSLYGEYVEYNQIPQVLIDAVTSTEDRRFFAHFGMDPMGLLRAVVTNYTAGRVVQGGSTITQQLAKVVFLSPERTIKRKVQELLLAFYLEGKFTKEEIITMYLNRIYLGSGNYGIDAASHSYFNKSARDLNLYEAATIAGLIKAPSRYSPLNNFELSQKRADQVLALMVDNEVLTSGDILRATEGLGFAKKRYEVGVKYPYFVDWVKDQLPDYIGRRKGEVVITTTLDPEIQKVAEESLAASLSVYGKKHHLEQGAVLIMSPQGDVLAMVGGKSYRESQFNRATQAYRQPGSSFKLFVYLAAMENGYTPEDVFVDEPIEYQDWAPENWNNKYEGEISLRNAFAKSINTVAVQLAQKVGIRKVINTARKLGISSDMNKDLSSALGTSEVTLLELTGAYAHFANYGKSVWTHGITEITDMDGAVLYKREDSGGHRVISEKATANMNDMMRNVVTSGTGKQAAIDRPAAGKTGTSQNSRDAWFIGFTHDYVAGVWLGNDDNKHMSHVGGGGLPAIIWHDIMGQINESKTRREIPVTESAVKRGREPKSIWDNIFGR